MKRWVVVLTIAILSLGTPSRGQTFWDTLGNLLNQGCNLTGQFNFGSNWEWICTLKSVYSNFKWLADNLDQYMQDLTVQMLIGGLEGTMQSLGWYIGPGVNQFATDLADFAKNVRQAPQFLRRAIARAMLEDAKQKYLPLIGKYPAFSPLDLLEKLKKTNPTIATGYLGQLMGQVKKIGKRTGAVEGVSNIAKEMEKKGESLTNVTKLTSQILTPKEAEKGTNGVVKPGVAEALVERAKTAASAREVMEITVEAISYLLRLQAASNPLLLDFMQAQLQAQLYSNGSIIGLYDQMAQQAEDEVGEAEFELQAYAVAANEGAKEAELEMSNISNMFVDIANMDDNLPDGGSLEW